MKFYGNKKDGMFHPCILSICRFNHTTINIKCNAISTLLVYRILEKKLKKYHKKIHVKQKLPHSMKKGSALKAFKQRTMGALFKYLSVQVSFISISIVKKKYLLSKQVLLSLIQLNDQQHIELLLVRIVPHEQIQADYK